MFIPTHLSASDPTANDDKSSGFIRGIGWLNTDTGEFFICTSDLDAAATWESVTGGATPTWDTFTATLSWTGTAPTVNTNIARYTDDGATIQFLIYINFTTAGGGTPTNLNITLPEPPADISVPLIPVGFISRTGSAYSKGENPYIDMDNPTPASRKLYFGGGFSLVAATTYGWCMIGQYEKA